MRNSWGMIYCLLTLILVISVAGCQDSDLKYSVGKDTIDFFGDGTFSIDRAGDGKTKMLRNHAETDVSKTFVETNVMHYKQIDQKVYVIGQTAYTVVDLQTGQFEKHENLNQFNEQDQERFRELKK